MIARVYILECSDGSYYVGSTRDTLETRMAQHTNDTFGGYTSTRRPVTLVWSQDFASVREAIAAERQLKGRRRAKKEALIQGDYTLLRALASRSSRSHPEEPQSGVSKDQAQGYA